MDKLPGCCQYHGRTAEACHVDDVDSSSEMASAFVASEVMAASPPQYTPLLAINAIRRSSRATRESRLLY
jgi:hypothetical protein